MQTLTLMAVHAHPDDESFGGGGTLARYAAEGCNTVLVTCTNGEEGEIVDPDMDPAEVKPRLADVRLGDRVALFTFRPGRIKREYKVDLPRPRHLEDVTVAKSAREILDDLREEINKSLEAEYAGEVLKR